MCCRCPVCKAILPIVSKLVLNLGHSVAASSDARKMFLFTASKMVFHRSTDTFVHKRSYSFYRLPFVFFERRYDSSTLEPSTFCKSTQVSSHFFTCQRVASIAFECMSIQPDTNRQDFLERGVKRPFGRSAFCSSIRASSCSSRLQYNSKAPHKRLTGRSVATVFSEHRFQKQNTSSISGRQVIRGRAVRQDMLRKYNRPTSRKSESSQDAQPRRNTDCSAKNHGPCLDCALATFRRSRFACLRQRQIVFLIPQGTFHNQCGVPVSLYNANIGTKPQSVNKSHPSQSPPLKGRGRRITPPTVPSSTPKNSKAVNRAAEEEERTGFPPTRG